MTTWTKTPTPPMEKQVSGMRISGQAPSSIANFISAFLDECEAPIDHQPLNGIHVVQDASILGHVQLEPRPSSTLILDLESVPLVSFFNEHKGNIRWFSRRDPRELVGPLLDHYRGTYFRSHTAEIVYVSDSDLEVISVNSKDVSPDLLAAVCAAREAGIPAKAIRRSLSKFFSKTPVSPLERTQAYAL